MGFFGRRKPAEPPPQTVFPRELWDDPKIGHMLKELGMSPDDPQNRNVTSDDITRMVSEGQKALTERSRVIHENLAAQGVRNVRLKPFWLIQDNCWNGEAGRFLIQMLHLNPYDNWNIAWLPEDEASSFIMDTPMHPHSVIPAFAEAGEKFILEIKGRLAAAHADVARTNDFGAFGDAVDQSIAEVKSLAGFFAAKLLEAHKAAKAESA